VGVGGGRKITRCPARHARIDGAIAKLRLAGAVRAEPERVFLDMAEVGLADLLDHLLLDRGARGAWPRAL
jgi:hypothetical protein